MTSAQMPSSRAICIAGGDGSGKSTQVAALATAFVEQGLTPAVVTIWDVFDDPVMSAKLPYENAADVFAYLKVLSPRSRSHFLFHALHAALDLAEAKSPDVLLLNAYWYKYFATEVAHGGDPAVLRSLAAGFPEPDLTFFLKISAETTLTRKDQPSDYETGYGDFLEFQRHSLRVLDQLSTDLGWTELDGTRDQDEITATILDAIGNR
ncbi:dTMP kinase [Antrihabitans cavernicola]|uniref:Thymidylate kinase n=1 Tax=Antrihabitans cavernicola TaxID=2495913 RepID=A0A5A7SI51_9NOCA|nr:hypothetical protein [Spelaeibacter cavernicola]KAA0024862.1 hypothetical protein FOY51_02740 [Spelaeibacter cavernicola]